ncbi:nuclear transport factor 2 family protein [Actinoplanes aureus]|uniref:Nuclear transport factor 2 family protein n=1 Tax=Actinoplanes aureus TaxID=2792083 RepID=A0A931CF91_9ACTN|nr:nuclear transport factor 2 family protein [Actinoplanes aureus]MBG0563830.1 nuclear transport factor 2 family protein [Actinoplanes aureus]
MDATYPFIDQWRAASEARDATEAAAALAEDVRLISPITEQFRFQGRKQVQDLLEVALDALESIKFTDQVADGDTVALFYEATVDRTRIFEAQRLRLDATGRISEITLYIRPLPALTKLMSRLGPELARRNGQPGLARVIPIASGMLHAMADGGERNFMPRAAPR